MKVLITGVAGLLGSRLADWITRNTQNEVVGVDDLSGGYVENIPSSVKFYQRNLADDTAVKEIIAAENPETVYHFAAYAAEGLSPFIRKYNYENNLIASTNLISASIEHEVQRFVFASSMSVYGMRYQPPFTEELPQHPIDPYGIAKYAVEQDLRVAYEHHGLEYTIVRPHNFYGVNQNIWDKYRNVLGIWMYQLLRGEQPTIFGDGLQQRAFSYVDDSLLPLWNASQNPQCVGETINLGGIREHTIIDACRTLLEVSGARVEPKFLEARHEAKYAWSSWVKSEKLLGFEHKTELHDGLAKMWQWAQTQPKRDRMVWADYQLKKGLYDYWKS